MWWGGGRRSSHFLTGSCLSSGLPSQLMEGQRWVSEGFIPGEAPLDRQWGSWLPSAVAEEAKCSQVPAQPDSHHHFTGSSGRNSRGTRCPGQRLGLLAGHSRLPGRASAVGAPRKMQEWISAAEEGKALPSSVHALPD